MKRTLALIIAIVFLSQNFIFAQEQQKKEEINSEYRISANDLLDISVYEEPDLNKTVRVGEDGTIFYPLLGNIKTKGLTTKELEAKLTELLGADYLVNPQVSVFIREHGKIAILGQVHNPGTYELKAGITLLEAIALTGGFTDKADVEHVKVVRAQGDQPQTFVINTNEIIKEGNKEEDVVLEPKDLVLVGELSESSSFIVILGQVRAPGRYSFKKGMTIIEAIALAGGLTDIAAANSTKVIRIEEGKKTVIQVPLGSILEGGQNSKTEVLQPEDTIIVPESFF